jgi:Flp pilus assembly pilin Flp
MMNQEKPDRVGQDESGASLPEYALLIALIAVVCLAAMAVLGTKINSVMSALGTSI